MHQEMNRRSFLKTAAATGAVLVAGGALAGCSSQGGGSAASAEPDAENRLVGYAPIEFSEETDVLVIIGKDWKPVA